jgi:iron complex transport system substrate-binding protein
METSVTAKRISQVIAGVLILSLLLAACGSTPVAVQTEAPGGLTLTVGSSRTVVFEELPQRIVIAGKSSLTIVNTFYLFPEAQDRLVGVVIGNQPVGDFVSLVDPAWDQKTVLAPDAGPEQIVPLSPDVVLLRSFMADSLGRSLAELDVPVVYFDLETPEQYSRDVSVLGQLLGNTARAETIGAFYRERLEGVEKVADGLSTGEKPRVLLVQYNDQGGEVAFNVPSAAWLQTMEVELAGGVPVWAEAAQGGGWTLVNFEQIAAWDPEQIFVVSYRVDSAEIVADLVADPQWQALQAVQEGAIYGFPADVFSWDQPDPRWILGVTWLAGKVHPDRFPGLDMERETVQFFSQMYGIDEAVVETRILPRINLEGKVE